jgi:osmotically inducible protein OsmC
VKVLYTAQATASGGRMGQVRSSDGHLDVQLAPPVELGGPDGGQTNPEQLFAAGYAACFHSAMTVVAQRLKTDIEGSSVTARVGLGATGKGGFGLTVALEASVPGVEPDQARTILEKAHEVCPYSEATRGNLDVQLSLAEG